MTTTGNEVGSVQTLTTEVLVAPCDFCHCLGHNKKPQRVKKWINDILLCKPCWKVTQIDEPEE